MTPHQVIEIRQLQPMVLRWVFGAAHVMAAVLLLSAAMAFGAALLAALKDPSVWAVLPRGDVLSIKPLERTAAMEQGIRAVLYGGQGAAQ
jgi:hypothetical protein